MRRMWQITTKMAEIGQNLDALPSKFGPWHSLLYAIFAQSESISKMTLIHYKFISLVIF